MSCERWGALVAQGERLLWEGSPERQAAERHFLACPRCSERAFLLDPSWALKREVSPNHRSGAPAFQIPGSRGPGGTDEADSEVAELKRKIVEAGRMRQFEGSVLREPGSIHAAAAAALVVVLLAGGALLGTKRGSWQAEGHDEVGIAVRATQSVPSTTTKDPSRSVAAASELSLPAVGFLAPAAARVYDLGQEEFALVMVVHETLDL